VLAHAHAGLILRLSRGDARARGRARRHDDSVNERHEGAKLNESWAVTKRLWRQTYAGSGETGALDTGGTCYRGEPPSWWFACRHQKPPRVVVHDEVLSAATSQQLVAELKRGHGRRLSRAV